MVFYIRSGLFCQDQRYIEEWNFPDSTYFVPMGVPSCKLEQIDIMMEELEAMRLKDIEGLNQEECAKKNRMYLDKHFKI